MPRNRNPLNKVLAKPGDPLVTERGLTIAPDRDGVDLTENDGVINAKAFKAKRQRTLKDLPVDMTMIKAIACVFMLRALGLTDREIATGLGISSGDLKTVVANPAYAECFNEVLQELINAQSEMLNARVAAYAGSALDNVAHLASNAKKDETKLTASRDLLDRAGVGPKSAINIANSANELRIQVVDGNKTVDIGLRQ